MDDWVTLPGLGYTWFLYFSMVLYWKTMYSTVEKWTNQNHGPLGLKLRLCTNVSVDVAAPDTSEEAIIDLAFSGVERLKTHFSRQP